jgi:hypothetical protein
MGGDSDLALFKELSGQPDCRLCQADKVFAQGASQWQSLRNLMLARNKHEHEFLLTIWSL